MARNRPRNHNSAGFSPLTVRADSRSPQSYNRKIDILLTTAVVRIDADFWTVHLVPRHVAAAGETKPEQTLAPQEQM